MVVNGTVLFPRVARVPTLTRTGLPSNFSVVLLVGALPLLIYPKLFNLHDACTKSLVYQNSRYAPQTCTVFIFQEAEDGKMGASCS